MKRLYILVSVMVVLSLCACGAKTQPTPTAAPTAAPTEAPAAETPAEAEPEEKAMDPNNPGSVLNYYAARGSEMYGSYAFMQLDTEGKKTWTAPLAGIQEFKVPDAFLNAKGGVRASGGKELFYGTGIVSLDIAYLPFTEAEYDAYVDWIGEFIKAHENPTDEDKIEYAKKVDEYNSNAYHLFSVLGIDNNGTAEDLKTALEQNFRKQGAPDDKLREYLNKIEIFEAGGAENYKFYLIRYERKSADFKETQADYREEYDALFDAVESYAANFTFMRPLALAQLVAEGTGLTFETKDLNDNPVIGSELFASHKATMLNIWSTTCSACMSEMPDIKKMAEEFEAKGGQVVGLVYDAMDEDLIADAKEIGEDLGLDFVNLLPTQEMRDFFKVQAFPTTYFFNEKGEVVGDPFIGVGPDICAARLNEMLENK